MTDRTEPDAYRLPAGSIAYRGFGNQLRLWPNGDPLRITADQADQIVANATPLWFTDTPPTQIGKTGKHLSD